VLVVLVVFAGLVTGWLRGGRVRHLGDVHLRGGWLAVAAGLGQVALALVPAAPRVLLAVPLAALVVFLWANRMLPGLGLLVLGLALNAAVIAVNGAMPVSRDAVLAVGAHPAEVAGARHRLLDDGDRLAPLADVVPLPALRTVVSAGDVVLAAGVAVLFANLMRPPRRRAA
jgi:hypothetical protein